MSKRPVLGETETPEGVRVVLFEDTWLLHVLDPQDGHPELYPYLAVALKTVAEPDHRELDPRPGRERFFKQHAGPSEWLMVVVHFGDEPARIVTALGYQHGQSPGGWTT